MEIEKIISDIKELKIQGAITIAKMAILGLHTAMIEVLKTSPKDITNKLNIYKDMLISTRSTEPAMRNILNMYEKKINILPPNKLNTSILNDIYNDILKIFNKEKEKITLYGKNLIQDGMNIFTHCHSTTVIDILKKAKEEGKHFTIYNTEARPKYQGRTTAKELSEIGIDIHHTVDNAAHIFIKKCDLFLFGADAIDSLGYIYNKIGTYTYCEIAKRYNVKTISCTGMLKFDNSTIFGKQEVIEEREPKEIWDNSDINVHIFNPAFDAIPKSLVNGITSEIGILSIDEFIIEAQKRLFI